MPDIKALKKELRSRCRERSAALTEAYRGKADTAIREAILKADIWQRAQSVFVYVSMWAEPDTRALIEDALAAGKAVYVPLCCPDHTMKAVRIHSLDELHPGTLGIPEPLEGGESAAPGEIDLALVPCMSASRSGARLGHGAGYYDRFLALHRCPALCLCYEEMLSDEIPADEYDVRMDAVVTEKGVSFCG